MSDVIKVYRFVRTGQCLVPTDSGYHPHNPNIEWVCDVEQEVAAGASLKLLIESAMRAKDFAMSEIAASLGWINWEYRFGRDFYTPGSSKGSAQGVLQPWLTSLHITAQRLGTWTGDSCSLLSCDEVVKWLNRLLEWATEKQKPEEHNSTPIIDATPVELPEDVPARFRQGREPGGEPLTPAYMLKMKSIWTFPNRTFFTRAFQDGRLTERFPVGKTFAYLYCECKVLSNENDELT